MVKTLTTLSLENYFSVLRHGVDRSPSLLGMLKRIKCTSKWKDVMWKLKNRKLYLHDEMILNKYSRKMNQQPPSKEDIQTLQRFLTMLGRSSQLGPTSIYKERIGWKPIQFVYLKKIANMNHAKSTNAGVG